jgi:hypothetical protein
MEAGLELARGSTWMIDYPEKHAWLKNNAVEVTPEGSDIRVFRYVGRTQEG